MSLLDFLQMTMAWPLVKIYRLGTRRRRPAPRQQVHPKSEEGGSVITASLEGRCTEHPDENASLVVNADGTWRCFACGSTGKMRIKNA